MPSAAESEDNMLTKDILEMDATLTAEELEERLQRAGITLMEYDEVLDTVILYNAAAEAVPPRARAELMARLESIAVVQSVISALRAD